MSEAGTEQQLRALERQGAHRHRPARFRYLQSLAERLAGDRQPAPAQLRKLQQALADFEAEFLNQKAHARALLDETGHADDAHRSALEHHLENGEFDALRRLIRQWQRTPSPLTGLLRALHNSDADPAPAPATSLDAALQQQHRLLEQDAQTPRRELKALRHLRDAQARLHTRQRVHHAIADTPGDAGPLNAQRQVTRALETLRDTAPAYLENLANYMDALMVLEKLGKKK
tara:strand:+ start:57230 stop:57922 length:693 start_codon:yes stop_codon:yes gene_type:complete